MAAKLKSKSVQSQRKRMFLASAELIVARFQQMRAEHRAIVGKIAEVRRQIGRSIGVCVSSSLDLVLCVCMCKCVCMRVCVCVCAVFLG